MTISFEVLDPGMPETSSSPALPTYWSRYIASFFLQSVLVTFL